MKNLFYLKYNGKKSNCSIWAIKDYDQFGLHYFRFESLTLSHNNMIALKPVLSAWLEEAEAAKRDPNSSGGFLPSGEKKRNGCPLALFLSGGNDTFASIGVSLGGPSLH